MPDDAQGNNSLVNGYKAVSGDKVLPSNHNPPLEDISSCLSARYMRDGRAPMLADMPMGNHKITGLADGGNGDEAITFSQLQAAILKTLHPTGKVDLFAMSSPPAGWIGLYGRTIGNAASGATERSNADTVDLFALLWSQFDNTILPIQDSTGAASTRGSSAEADYAANKRLTVFNARGEFLRGWDGGRGVDTGRALGSGQVSALGSHTHTGTTESAGLHTHTVGPTGTNNYTGGAGAAGGTDRQFNVTLTTSSAGAHTHAFTTNATGDTETRPRNLAFLVCIKL